MNRGNLSSAIAAFTLLVVLASGGNASAEVLAHPPATAPSASLTSEAADIDRQARRLRTDVANLLDGYITTYQSRFSAEELELLSTYASRADAKLNALVRTTSRYRNLVARGSRSSLIRQSASNALATWKRGKAEAEASWDEVRQIMEPRLSLFEKLAALSDYNSAMDEFDALGMHLAEVQGRTRS